MAQITKATLYWVWHKHVPTIGPTPHSGLIFLRCNTPSGQPPKNNELADDPGIRASGWIWNVVKMRSQTVKCVSVRTVSSRWVDNSYEATNTESASNTAHCSSVWPRERVGATHFERGRTWRDEQPVAVPGTRVRRNRLAPPVADLGLLGGDFRNPTRTEGVWGIFMHMWIRTWA